MPAILGNTRAEELILDIRTGRHAAAQSMGGPAGAFLMFPTSVVTSDRAGTHLVYPLHMAVEPGSLVSAPGDAEVTAVVAGVKVTGTFEWSLSADRVAPARYQFKKRGREVAPPPWAAQLPCSQSLVPHSGVSLCREQARMRRRAEAAEHCLLRLSEHVIRLACRGPICAALRYRPVVDVDDVVQRGLQTAVRLLPVYTSPARPPCSWMSMLRLDGRRDMHREVFRLDWMPVDSASALVVAQVCGVNRQRDPAATLSELMAGVERLGLSSFPRIGATQLDVAMRAPGLVEHERIAHEVLPGPEAEGPTRRSGPPPGVVAARVARLVTDDRQLIDRAAAGDGRALAQVAEHVVRRLGERREAPRLVRRRCWEHFLGTGQLFTSPIGLDRFSSAAGPGRLAAIDRSLQRAVGLTPVSSSH